MCMSSTTQSGGSRRDASRNSRPEANGLDSNPAARSNRPSALRTDVSSSTTATSGAWVESHSANCDFTFPHCIRYGEDQMKCRTPSTVMRGPELAAVRAHDLPANCQPEAQAIWLGREE